MTSFASLWDKYADKIGAAAVEILVIVAAYLVVRFIAFKLINRIFGSIVKGNGRSTVQARAARVGALQTVLRSAVGFVLGMLAVIMVLQAAGINIAPLIMSASVAGLAVGFGAQKLVRDVIAGFFILMEDQYGVGDYVSIGGVTGVVEELGMRTTQIRDAAGKLNILSNGDIAQVCNHSRGTLRASIDVAVPATTDLDKARRVLNEVGESIARDLPEEVREPYACAGLAQITGAAATLRLTGSTLPQYQDHVHMELNSRIRQAFQENGLQLA